MEKLLTLFGKEVLNAHLASRNRYAVINEENLRAALDKETIQTKSPSIFNGLLLVDKNFWGSPQRSSGELMEDDGAISKIAQPPFLACIAATLIFPNLEDIIGKHQCTYMLLPNCLSDSRRRMMPLTLLRFTSEMARRRLYASSVSELPSGQFMSSGATVWRS